MLCCEEMLWRCRSRFVSWVVESVVSKFGLPKGMPLPRPYVRTSLRLFCRRFEANSKCIKERSRLSVLVLHCRQFHGHKYSYPKNIRFVTRRMKIQQVQVYFIGLFIGAHAGYRWNHLYQKPGNQEPLQPCRVRKQI